MHRCVIILLLLVALPCALPAAEGRFSTGSPATTRNDDSCDISVLPAATLLLPYFEVDVESAAERAQTTIFTITNVSRYPQIARVTLWSDWSYPLLTFNLFLTGYDVQALNLRDILVRGVIAPPNGTSTASVPGPLSAGNASNPNFALNAANDCEHLPGTIPPTLAADLRSALTSGQVTSCSPSQRVGNVHTNAVGYATVDVVATCSSRTPADAGYFTSDLLYDNVLGGDYEQIDPGSSTGNYAGGNPMVHIRAIPEGGAAGSRPGTNLPYTFYDRYLPDALRSSDRRQPLPSVFAARYIEGGSGSFNTKFKIWREGVTSRTTCTNAVLNRDVPFGELIRFDEHENAEAYACGNGFPYCPPGFLSTITLPVTSSTITSSNTFPPSSNSGDVGGWMYINLNNSSAATGASRPGFNVAQTIQNARPSQNWIVISQSAEGRYAVEYDGLALGNGCSPAASLSPASGGDSPIGPRPDANP